MSSICLQESRRPRIHAAFLRTSSPLRLKRDAVTYIPNADAVVRRTRKTTGLSAGHLAAEGGTMSDTPRHTLTIRQAARLVVGTR